MTEDGWNMRDPERVALDYCEQHPWRNRVELMEGRESIRAFLLLKWRHEFDYRMVRELWSFTSNNIAARFAAEWHDASGAWVRSCGNEIWEFAEGGLMRRRLALVKDTPIFERERMLLWPLGRRPNDHPSLTALGL